MVSLFIVPAGARSSRFIPRSSTPTRSEKTPAPPTAAKFFVVRVEMSLKSDGTSADVVSSVAPVVASQHGVSEDQRGGV